MGIHSFKDLLALYPIRHVDRTKVEKIINLGPHDEYAQVSGKLISLEIAGQKAGRRLVAKLKDDTGEMELVWFQGISWIQKFLQVGQQYLVFGKTGFFMHKPQMAHPEIESWSPEKASGKNFLEPIYPSTEKLKTKGLNGRAIGKFTHQLLQLLAEKDLPENLPPALVAQYKFISHDEAFRQIHFPTSALHYGHALRRLKFEELFFAQLRLGLIKSRRHRFSKGLTFAQVGDRFNTFYREFLPFELTNAQKRVLKEIRKDTGSGRQMNRLLQGDVGSGKTIVALMLMLIAADNGFQSVLMAPTEILAQQHFKSITGLLKDMPVCVKLLTGSSVSKERKKILAGVMDGEVDILVGTHAVIEKDVQFSNLGLAVVDEQHKFGVEQRSKLWKKNSIPPHVLVMTATPIPRTLALTAYGDLDYSVIDELPPGRQPIVTLQRSERSRPQVMDFVKEEIKKGRQAYFVYPLIEESAKLDLENLMKGFEEVKSFFPEPAYWISMVHGGQPQAKKEPIKQRFEKGKTKTLAGTRVME